MLTVNLAMLASHEWPLWRSGAMMAFLIVWWPPQREILAILERLLAFRNDVIDAGLAAIMVIFKFWILLSFSSDGSQEIYLLCFYSIILFGFFNLFIDCFYTFLFVSVFAFLWNGPANKYDVQPGKKTHTHTQMKNLEKSNTPQHSLYKYVAFSLVERNKY